MSCKPSKFRKFLIKFFPFLFKMCPDKNYHWGNDRLCFCRVGCYTKNWNGGIYDLKTGAEYFFQWQMKNSITSVEPDITNIQSANPECGAG